MAHGSLLVLLQLSRQNGLSIFLLLRYLALALSIYDKKRWNWEKWRSCWWKLGHSHRAPPISRWWRSQRCARSANFASLESICKRNQTLRWSTWCRSQKSWSDQVLFEKKDQTVKALLSCYFRGRIARVRLIALSRWWTYHKRLHSQQLMLRQLEGPQRLLSQKIQAPSLQRILCKFSQSNRRIQLWWLLSRPSKLTGYSTMFSNTPQNHHWRIAMALFPSCRPWSFHCRCKARKLPNSAKAARYSSFFDRSRVWHIRTNSRDRSKKYVWLPWEDSTKVQFGEVSQI